MTAVALDPGLDFLLRSEEPAIRHRSLVDLVDATDDDPRVVEAREGIPAGRIVSALLADQPGLHPYSKWTGAHWRLVSLMDLGVPGDLPGTREAVERVLRWLTGRGRQPRPRAVQVIDGLARQCASMDGNALAVAVHFGLADDPRTLILAETLLEWQWPDGGWNCDRDPGAHHSSVNESFQPLRGLAAFARSTSDRAVAAGAQEAVDRAADFFLRHRVAYSETTGAPIKRDVVRLHYPPYWHYDVLAGLRALAVSGHVTDPRAADALDLLEHKRSDDGLWAADARHDRPPGTASSLVDVIDWPGDTAGGPSEPITLFALLVLKAAGRLSHHRVAV
jgi:hypothetical protein